MMKYKTGVQKNMSTTQIVKQPHHEQQDLCSSRASYRQGRQLTAVKVYTVNDESIHLLVSNVPAINLLTELCTLCNRFGNVTTCILVAGYENEEKFVETFHVQYSRIQSARHAKKKLDGRSFYGGILHVCYAPELETVDETRAKLVQRRKEIATRIKKRLQSNDTIAKSCRPGYTSESKISTETTIVLQPAMQLETQNSCSNSLLGNVTGFPPPYPNPRTQQARNPQVFGMRVAGSNFPRSAVEEAPFTNHYKTPVRNDAPFSQSTLRFIPRPVAVSKRIVFHKKPMNSEESNCISQEFIKK